MSPQGSPRDSSRITAGMNRASSRVEAGRTGLFLTCGGKRSVPLELGQVSLETSGVLFSMSRTLSSSKGNVGFFGNAAV